MKNAAIKNFFREIKNNKGRFLSIFFIVLLGTAFFAGLRATGSVMKYRANLMYADQNLMDMRLLSTLGITEEDIADLEASDAVETAEGAKTADMLVEHDQEQKVIKVIGETSKINLPYLTEGRMPEAKNECIADVALARKLGYRIGDTVKLISGTGDDIADTLNTTEFTVTGIGNLPYYIDLTRGASQIGDGSITGFIVVLPEVFELDVFTEAYVKLKGTEGLYAFGDQYDDVVDAAEESIETDLDAFAERRYETVITDARTEIDEHKQEIADGEQELADAKNDLDEGRAELDDAEKELADAKKELADAKAEIDDGEKELVDAKAEIDNGEQELTDAKAEIDKGAQELADAKAQVDKGEKELADAKAEIDKGAQELADAKKTLDESEEQLAAAQSEIDDGKRQIADAEAQIKASEEELAVGWEEYYAGKEQLDTGKEQLDAAWEAYNAGQTELAAQEEQLAAGRAEIEAGYAQYEENYAAYAEQKAAYEEGEAQYAAGMALLEQDPSNEVLRAQMEALRAQLDAAAPQIEAAGAQLAAAKQLLDEKNAELEAGETLIEKAKAEAEKGYQTLSKKQAEFDASKKQLDAAYKKLSGGQEELEAGKAELAARKNELAEGERQVKSGLAQLEAGRKEYEQGLAEWESGRRQYESGVSEWESGRRQYEEGVAEWQDGVQQYEEGLAEWQDGKKKYEDGLSEYEDGVAEYEEGVLEWEDGYKKYNDEYPDAMEEITDGKKKLADAEEELNDLEFPDTYVLDRGKVACLVSFGGDADRIDTLSEVFPAIFFLVAALVSLTAMTRMVEEQRLEIGTMKALGAGNGKVAAKYICYAALASVGGGIAGIFIGQRIIPFTVMDAYHSLYTGIPVGDYPYNVYWSVIAVVLAAATTIIATIIACWRVLAGMPSVLMRPEAPKNGSRVIFERFKGFWSRASFTKKATIRNLFRYKKRFFMTIIGIGGCMALMMVGYGIQDSITGIAKSQYTDLFRQNATVTINTKASAEEVEELEEIIASYEGMKEYIDADQTAVTLSANDKERSAFIYVPKTPEKATEYVRLKDYRRDYYYEFPKEGALITEKAAQRLGVGVGDTVEVRLTDDSEPEGVKVAGIVENYVMHYLYISPETYYEMFGEEPEYNKILIKYEGAGDKQYEKRLGEKLISNDACSAVEFVTDLKENIDDMLNSLNAVMWVLILASAFLAFVVLYNLNSINMTERKRELATLKVLGFHDTEVAMYIYRENIILTAIGIVLGIFLGIVLHRFVITTVEVDLMMFGRHINIASFVICAVWTALFSLVVNLIMFVQFKKIDMIESLKSVE